MQDDRSPDAPEKSGREPPASITFGETLLIFLFLGLIVIIGIAMNHLLGFFHA
ncbi:MAG: hypothetical protein ACLPPF_16410 [Rhodomicrobium sp.]